MCMSICNAILYMSCCTLYVVYAILYMHMSCTCQIVHVLLYILVRMPCCTCHVVHAILYIPCHVHILLFMTCCAYCNVHAMLYKSCCMLYRKCHTLMSHCHHQNYTLCFYPFPAKKRLFLFFDEYIWDQELLCRIGKQRKLTSTWKPSVSVNPAIETWIANIISPDMEVGT